MQATQYKIIASFTIKALEQMVESYLAEGWRTVGGISVVKIDTKKRVYDEKFLQAMEK